MRCDGMEWYGMLCDATRNRRPRPPHTASRGSGGGFRRSNNKTTHAQNRQERPPGLLKHGFLSSRRWVEPTAVTTTTKGMSDGASGGTSSGGASSASLFQNDKNGDKNNHWHFENNT
mmetsp:Transcript_23829/g.50667  ORF Transcript_23829/g.50667 Transcript_23829/m.50667 type:complete len:117 (+) Transcript_23829:98-448(+)